MVLLNCIYSQADGWGGKQREAVGVCGEEVASSGQEDLERVLPFPSLYF